MMAQVAIPTQRCADQAIAHVPSLTKQTLKSAQQIKIYTSAGGLYGPKHGLWEKLQDPVNSHTIIA